MSGLGAKGWALRVLGWVDSLTPTGREAWQFGVGSLVPFLVLAGERLWVMSRLETPALGTDRLWVMCGEAEFWPLWFLGWTYASRLPLPHWRGAVRALFHACNILILVLSAAELAFFDVTGGRGDLDSLLFGLEDFAEVWPVVASELTLGHYLGAAGVVVVTFVPMLWRPAGTGRTWIGRAALLTLIPAIWMETSGRPRPNKAFRPLQKTFVESLFWEGLERVGDRTFPPDPSELARVVIGPPSRPYNVVLVVLESVGARRTTVYNEALPTTPALAELAATGLVVEHAYAVVPHTSKALVTTLCGDWPNLTGDAREAKPGGLPPTCLPRLLAGVGYRTAFLQTAREDFEDRVDLVRQAGFEDFFSRDTLSGPFWEKNNYFGIDDRAMLYPGLEWSKQEPGRPFFATYLTLASHHDYKLPSHWALLDFPSAAGRLEQYFNAVRYVDDFVDRLYRGYAEANLVDNTLFVVLGDHGEGFGEHGRYQHDLTIYEEGLQVPMVLHGPKALDGRTGKIGGRRQQIDILPTVLDVIGAPVLSGPVRGQSLLSDPPQRVLFHSCWRTHRCLARRDNESIFLYHFADLAPQWFNTEKDWPQKHDLARKASSADKDEWEGALRRWWGNVRGLYAARRARWAETVQRPDDSRAYATWGGVVALLGCRPEATRPLVPGEQAWVTCRWRAESRLRESWTLAVQVRVGSRTGKASWSPHMGQVKMWNWRPGWSIDDTFRVEIPAYSKEGEAVVSVGWQRIGGIPVETDDGRERIDVATVVVGKRVATTPGGQEGIELQPRAPWPTAFDLPLQEGEAEPDETHPGDDDPPVDDDRGKAAPDAE